MRVRAGSTYLYNGWSGSAAGGSYRYRVLNFALCGRTLQEQVVYEGLEGPDRGRWFTCPLADFAAKFVPESHDAAPEAKAAGAVSTGSGF